MSEQIDYGDALRQMGEEPPEENETFAPPGWGGKRVAGPGKKLGRPSKSIQRVTITLDSDLAQLVRWHANARGNSLSKSINALLGEALRNHEIDAEAHEVH